jgi:F0F1-type ATP synthase assembly protein I
MFYLSLSDLIEEAVKFIHQIYFLSCIYIVFSPSSLVTFLFVYFVTTFSIFYRLIRDAHHHLYGPFSSLICIF